MRKHFPTLVAAGLLFTSFSGMAAIRPHHPATHALVRHSLSSHARHAAVTEHASMPRMSSERATEIQAALIQHGYMTGEATGTWDAASVSAMQKMQSDNGWQTKLVPDSRALIKLGLGPNNSSIASAAPIAAGTQTLY